MRIALDTEGKRVDASKADRNQKYMCPVCGEPVIPKAIESKYVCSHFAHKTDSHCDEWKSDMSEWHYNWQEKFSVECREIVLEKDGIKHRADILINDVVIEFQHSPISVEEFNARNQFYLECGKSLIWIFDLTGKIRLMKESNFYFNRNNIVLKLLRMRPHFYNYNSERSKYQLFFQDGDSLFYVQKEEYKEFLCYNPGIIFSQDNFLKCFGCCDKADVESIDEIIKKEWKKQEKIIIRNSMARTMYVPNNYMFASRRGRKRRL